MSAPSVLRRVSGTSLLASFSALSLVTFAAMAVLLGGVVHDRVESVAIAHDGEAVEFLAARLSSVVTAEEMRTRPGRLPRYAVSQFLRYDHHGPEYANVRVWGTDGRALKVAAAGSRQTAGADDPESVRAALEGRSVHVVHRDGDTALLHFYVPIPSRVDGAPPVGALTVTQDAGGVFEEIAALAGTMNMIVFGGLAALWLILVPIVAAASRRLRRYAQVREHEATHDELTGLPNRRALLTRLAGADPRATGLIVLDVDGFKAINTLFGQAHGDCVLRLVADRLRQSAPPGAWVARLGGDEFAIVIDADGADAVCVVGSSLCAAVGELVVDGRGTAAVAGVAILGEDAGDSGSLVERASAALAAAKTARVDVVRYAPAHDALMFGSERQREEIQALLEHPDRITTVFQPIVQLATGRLVGYEALTRVAGDPPRGPDQWFAQAHRGGLGPELEALAVRRALAMPGRPRGTYLALNLSPSAVRSQPVLDVLPADLRGIVIEITEHEMVADFDDLGPALDDLRARGARIAIDDAGAGYAGLTHLMRIRPDLIKLDRSLIEGIDADETRAALVESFVHFARQIGAGLCAEGVETREELRALSDLQVMTAQGYLLARPSAPWVGVSADVVTARVEALAGSAVGA